MPLLPGEILNKRYRVVNLLAESANGAVYRAWDLNDRQDVAIKEYLDPSAETQKLFRAEAVRLSNIKHDQLPTVRDHFCLDDTGQYLVSDFISGVDLQDLMKQYGPLPSDLIIAWLQAACRPLTHLHQKKQLHLNIKPVNLRLRPDGELFLVDTGLPGLGLSAGSGGYTAPEQQMSGVVTTASDIYGLGATLYSLLTNKAPPDALRRESGLETLVPAREVNPDVEPYLSVAASRAMDLRPEVRFETAGDFAKALERPVGRPALAISEPRRTARAYAQAQTPVRQRSRRKQIEQRTIFALVAILLIVGGVVIGLSLAGRTPAVQEQQVAATATLRSQIVAALTAITTVTPTPAPSATPIPTPAPLIDEQTGAKMVYVPSGSFRMGSDETEPDEAPSQIIRVDAYYLDETEVTNGQYAQCVEAGECQSPGRTGATYHPSYYGDVAYDDYPVIFVNWNDARDFCSWRGARLPSEAEWERAAGFDPVMGIKHTYPWGDIFDGTLVNFCDVNCPADDRDTTFDDGHVDTAPVGSYPNGRSPLGLYDMSGNVMEWVSDWYDPRAYESAADTNPLGPLDGEFKSLRGGSWLSSEDQVRVSGRGSYDPTVRRAHLGFRCAITAP
ncbi:MAG TPA: SUMF1/EgtB/PvdO family nonheme iron enzyme [Anaerolineae bacterium]|jgi:formylglycine-generating enzyme required for sulfatase activity|nr:SUMF1/EgtB/PvdO family nonheme iron enzyme [Anaerolineae bacterium]